MYNHRNHPYTLMAQEKSGLLVSGPCFFFFFTYTKKEIKVIVDRLTMFVYYLHLLTYPSAPGIQVSKSVCLEKNIARRPNRTDSGFKLITRRSMVRLSSLPFAFFHKGMFINRRSPFLASPVSTLRCN